MTLNQLGRKFSKKSLPILPRVNQDLFFCRNWMHNDSESIRPKFLKLQKLSIVPYVRVGNR